MQPVSLAQSVSPLCDSLLDLIDIAHSCMSNEQLWQYNVQAAQRCISLQHSKMFLDIVHPQCFCYNSCKRFEECTADSGKCWPGSNHTLSYCNTPMHGSVLMKTTLTTVGRPAKAQFLKGQARKFAAVLHNCDQLTLWSFP